MALFALLCTLPVFAGLGGDASSVQLDQAHIQGTLRSTATAAYTLHEIQSPTGTIVREYVSPAGKVFAVAWKGPWMPDLSQLLGPHFEAFQQAVQSQTRVAHGPIIIHQSGLVVELGGHMRSFAGRAYLPDQIPAAVRAEDIR